MKIAIDFQLPLRELFYYLFYKVILIHIQTYHHHNLIIMKSISIVRSLIMGYSLKNVKIISIRLYIVIKSVPSTSSLNTP